MEVGGQRHAPAGLTLGKRPDTQHRGGCLGPQDQSEGVRKISLPPGFDPRRAATSE